MQEVDREKEEFHPWIVLVLNGKVIYRQIGSIGFSPLR